MKAGVDLDGVVADLMRPFLKEVNKEFNLKLRYEDISTYRFEDWIPLNIEDLRVIWEAPEFILGQPLLPWAKWGINRLKDFGYSIHIITARKSHLKTFTLEWLEKHKIPFDDIVTGKFEEKWSYIRRNNIDILIEDRFEYAWDACYVCKRAYLIDAPYNQQLPSAHLGPGFGDCGEVIRVDGWRDIIRLERGFLNESNSMR